MSLLLGTQELEDRRAVARGSLAPLSIGLRHELAPVLDGRVRIPREKALLSRTGGRCPRDGTLLTFDPLDPRHRCPRCGLEVTGEMHDRFRPYWYQLWLAERVVHAALLGVLLDDRACVDAAASLLERFAAQYLHYPNRDNVLGPSRPFFSTYLESIWLLQLVVALDLLETGAPSPAASSLGGVVRERLVEPSVALIASYDEGMSNRQVWNDAAMIAAGTMLGRRALVERALEGPSGLHAHLRHSLLDDGSWYEGENYHLFAHRGLWYGVTMAERLGRPLPAALATRFAEGFASPFRTLLPDLTYPSRRDSQYAVSVRQPRFAESCELGLARSDDSRLLGMLARLYDPSVPRADTGRAASTADVERNLAATALTRADLSWRSLLFARAELPPLVPEPLGSDLLPAQGFAILRRDEGRTYVGLDYGHSGGGHGHPDRLNLLLSDGDVRWFDDPGTGSYTDESLHWYRSTLAHTAPLLDRRSQPRVHGTLLAFNASANAAQASASAELAPGCTVRRTVMAADGYLVDVIEWEAAEPHEVALPLHGVRIVGASGADAPSTPARLEGGSEREDGFSFLRDVERLEPDPSPVRVFAELTRSDSSSSVFRGWIFPSPGGTAWRAVAPGPPGSAAQPMALVAASGHRGRLVSVFDWRGTLSSVDLTGDVIHLVRVDGTIEEAAVGAMGASVAVRDAALAAVDEPLTTLPPVGRLPLRRVLGERDYRRSEQSWEEAGRPECTVDVRLDRGDLVVVVDAPRAGRRFVAVDAENPYDNEPAAIDGDGVQLYLESGGAASGWLLVPIAGGDSVSVRAVDGWAGGLELRASWQPSGSGYRLTARVPLSPGARDAGIDVLVNETAPERTRRRGQLVLSGASGEFVYLRGDRHDPERLLRFSLADD